MQDEPLTPDERAAIDRLPREAEPPSHLEDRVVGELHRSGRLRGGRARASWLRYAAAIALLAGGILIGRLTARPVEVDPGAGYLLLLYGSASSSGQSEAALSTEYAAWAHTLRDQRQLVSAERLRSEARVLGTTAEAAGGAAPVGFFVIRAESLAAAEATAATCPHLKYGGTVVVRPIG